MIVALLLAAVVATLVLVVCRKRPQPILVPPPDFFGVPIITSKHVPPDKVYFLDLEAMHFDPLQPSAPLYHFMVARDGVISASSLSSIQRIMDIQP